ncbi:hypothetical protein N9W79_01095 [bacterium]|nr:hypothetical protein [bacterium]
MSLVVKNTLLVLISLLLVSCQTAPKKLERTVLPRTVLPLFSKCGNSDGGASLVINMKSRVVSGLQLDWIKDGLRLAGEVSDPIGSTILAFEGNGNQKTISMSGNFSRNLSKLSRNESDFIEIDGHQIGVKFSELSCFLDLKIPFQWTNHIMRKRVIRNKESKKMERLIIEFNDDERMIWTSYYPSEKKLCSKIKWNQFLGLISHKIVLCQWTGETPWRAKLELDPESSIEWSKEIE